MAVGGGSTINGNKLVHAWASKGCAGHNAREKNRIEFLEACSR
jgi:hypothetical protein